MNQFTFTSKEKRFSIALMIVGVIATVWGLFIGDHAGARIWTNVLQNTVFFTGIAFMALFLMSAHITAYAGWFTPFKRVWESMYSFLIVGAILITLIAVGLFTNMHDLYHWAADGITDPNSPNYDSIIAGKALLLNKLGFAVGTVGLVAIWVGFGNKLRKLSIEQESAGWEATYKKIKIWAGAFMPVAGFSSFAVILYLVMSIDPHWYSTMFAWYTTASWLVSAVAATILFLIYLKGKGYLPNVNDSHFHDLGKYLFGFSIFWTYLWFSQFMLIWYANIGEETVYFQYRRDNFPVLFWANLAINFVLPLLILIRNTSKRRMGIMAFMAGLLLFGHWLDFFLMIKPGTWHMIESHHEGHDAHDETHGDASSTIPYSEAKAMFTQNEEHAQEEHQAESHAYTEEGQHGQQAHEEAGVAHEQHGEDEDHGAYAESGYDEAHGDVFEIGFHMPGGVEIGMMLGFLGLYLFVFFSSLTRANLIPKNDPYLDEGDHHHYEVQGF
jgi:Ni/Fe-hydrogenase subunit HybB-like protein